MSRSRAQRAIDDLGRILERSRRTRGGARPGAGQPPIAGVRQTERLSLAMTEAERAEIEASVPENEALGRWIVEAALMRARRAVGGAVTIHG